MGYGEKGGKGGGKEIDGLTNRPRGVKSGLEELIPLTSKRGERSWTGQYIQ